MNNNLIKLFCPLELKENENDSKTITISGIANATVKDRHGDVILQEAWTKGGLTNYAKNPIVLAFHQHDKPIGKCTALSVSEGGLSVVAEVSKAAGNVFELIKEGILKAFSIGFRVKEADYDSATDIFVIKDLELFEVSVVSVPANQDSLFEVSKSFDNVEEYLQFKKLYSKEPEKSATINKEKNIMDQEVLTQLMSKVSEETAKAVSAALEKAANEKAAAEKAAVDEQKAKEEIIKLGQTGAERLLKDVEGKVTDEVTNLKKELADLQSAIKENAAELIKLRSNPVGFTDKQDGQDATLTEKATAVLLAKTLNKDVKETKYFSGLVQKYGVHVPSAYWEDQVSTNLESEIRKRLVVAPIFMQMNMPSNILRLPLNPEAGYGTWVLTTSYGTTDSSGAEATHTLKEVTLTAYKLATKEFLGYEEEDDALVALMPLVRDALIRRSARSIDKALLIGTASGVDPLKGITVWATAGDQVTVATTAKPTVATLAALRREMGDWGLDPSGVVYIVSSDVYYDLLDDDDFRTNEKVGNNATILNGQIGNCNGSPVLVSGEFASKGNGVIGAVAVAPRNFIFGQYKTLRVETDTDVEKQRRILVATQRLAFQQISSTNGNGAGTLKWTT